MEQKTQGQRGPETKEVNHGQPPPPALPFPFPIDTHTRMSSTRRKERRHAPPPLFFNQRIGEEAVSNQYARAKGVRSIRFQGSTFPIPFRLHSADSNVALNPIDIHKQAGGQAGGACGSASGQTMAKAAAPNGGGSNGRHAQPIDDMEEPAAGDFVVVHAPSILDADGSSMHHDADDDVSRSGCVGHGSSATGTHRLQPQPL